MTNSHSSVMWSFRGIRLQTVYFFVDVNYSMELLPYLREKIVMRMMVYLADAVEKGAKSVTFLTRYTVSSTCCVHFRCEGTFRVSYETGKILTAHLFVWSFCHCSMSGCYTTSILLQRPQKKTAQTA